MTVPYLKTLPPSFSSIGWFKGVVCRWRGSVYKLLVREWLIFCLIWYFIWFALKSKEDRTVVDQYIKYCREYQTNTRTVMAFLLVYYYQQIYARARTIFFDIPFPDSIFLTLHSTVGGNNERGRALRNTVFRYVLSTTFIGYHSASTKFQIMYPRPYEALLDLGLLTSNEIKQIKKRFEEYPYFGELAFIPMAWAAHTVRQAFEEGNIFPEGKNGGYRVSLQQALDAIYEFRKSYGRLLFQVYLPFPLLISQLVTVIVYLYFIVAVFAQQDLGEEPTFYSPIFTSMEFFVYMGALRVGQTYSNPLGGDDDDYELVSFFNRNLRLAHLYGCYGKSNLDFSLCLPPIVDLSGVQETIRSYLPVQFYRPDNASSTATQFDSNQTDFSDDQNRTSDAQLSHSLLMNSMNNGRGARAMDTI